MLYGYGQLYNPSQLNNFHTARNALQNHPFMHCNGRDQYGSSIITFSSLRIFNNNKNYCTHREQHVQHGYFLTKTGWLADGKLCYCIKPQVCFWWHRYTHVFIQARIQWKLLYWCHSIDHVRNAYHKVTFVIGVVLTMKLIFSSLLLQKHQ